MEKTLGELDKGIYVLTNRSIPRREDCRNALQPTVHLYLPSSLGSQGVFLKPLLFIIEKVSTLEIAGHVK